ncbi:hypothetical protein [Streptomyces sp. NPDC002276]
MSESGVSSPGRHVDIASALKSTPRAVARPSVLRCPELPLPAYFRVAALAHARGLIPDGRFRLIKFLSQQALDPATGHVVGRWGTDQVDGGLTLAERYAYVHGIGEDRFWDDLKGVYRLGFAERAIAPAPGRRAVYALCLRTDAIPAHDLPEDLARALHVWDMPEEAEDPHEGAVYGRLTSRPAPKVTPHVVEVRRPEQRAQLAELAAAARWEHPAGSRAAQVAAEIYGTAKWLASGQAPDLRCTAVAPRDRAAELTARIHRMMTLGPNGKPSPLYAKGFNQLSGALSTGSLWPVPSQKMATAKTTPSAAPGKRVGAAFGDDLASTARGVMRRVWHEWRRELGRGEVFLPQLPPEEQSRSVTGSTWDDLHRTAAIALRRGATPTLLVELLTRNIVRRDEWGVIVEKPSNVGRLAGWRLWNYIKTHDNPHFVRRRHVPQAAHVTWWDEAAATQRDAARRRADQQLEERKAEEAARLQRTAEEWAETRGRWGLDRFEQPDAEASAPEPEPRRWAQQPEHVHLDELAGRQRPLPSRSSRQAEAEWRAARDQARRDKRARRARDER